MGDKKVTFQVVIEDCQKDIELLQKTLDSFKSCDYPKDKFALVLSAKKESEWNKIPKIIDKLKQSEYIATAIFSIVKGDKNHETFCFSTYKQAYFYCKIFSGVTVENDFFSLANKHYKYDIVEGENICAISSFLAIDRYMDYLDYDLMQKDLIEKTKTKKKYIKV